MRFMAIASASCASLLMEPYDMAPVLKRLTIDSTGSTSSSGIGSIYELEIQQPAQRASFAGLVVDQRRVALEQVIVVGAHGPLQEVNGLRVEQMAFPVLSPLVVAARGQHSSVG